MARKLLYIQDHRYYKVGNHYFSSGTMSNKVFDRFRGGFDSISVIARIEEKNEQEFDKSLYEEITDENIEFLNRFTLSLVFSVMNPFKNEYFKYSHIVARVPGFWTQLLLHLLKFLNPMYSVSLGLEVVGCPYDSLSNHNIRFGRFLAPLIDFSQKVLVKNSDYVCYVTESYLQSRYPTKGRSIHASNVVIENFRRKGYIPNEQHAVQPDSSAFRIGMVGSSSVPYKGHETLISALNQLKLSKRVEVSFVGGGSDEQWCKLLAQNTNANVKYVCKGRLKPGLQMNLWYDSVDLFINPSKQEGLPRCVIEAMSRSCAVLASSVAGTPELLNSSSMHKPGQVDELSEQIVTFLEDPSRCNTEGERNYKVAQSYNYEILNRRRVAFWTEFARGIE